MASSSAHRQPAIAGAWRWRRLAHLPREARDTLFLLALIGWVLLPQLARLPLWSSLSAALILAWRALLAITGRPLPRRWLLAVLLVAGVLATWATYGTLAGADAGVTLVVTLLALKTLELRVRRDALVVFFLCFFTLLTGFFYSQSIATAVVMLVGALGLLTALVNAHRPVGTPTLRESARTALGLALAGAPIMIALFIFFPRFAPLWGVPDDGIGRSGLSATMNFGQIARLALDDGIALRVRFEGAPPSQNLLYFRGPVLQHFDGQEWTPRGGDPQAFVMPPRIELRSAAAPIAYQVTLEPHHNRWLLTLDATPAAPQLPAHWHARQSGALEWVANRPIGQLLRYSAESYAPFSYNELAWNGQPRSDLSADLQLPTGYNPRTLALSRELKDQAGGDAEAIARAALNKLQTGGYRYTLEPGTTGRDSADEFWFESKQGFCEHIASAFVVLMRGAGVPARIVTGFQGGERNNLDGYWVVRNSDAHAWTEVWIAGQGWQRVDPTAAVMPARIGQDQRLRPAPGLVAGALGTLDPRLLHQMRAVWETLNNRWNQWVLNYTQDRQFDLLRHMGFSQPAWEDLGKVLALLLAAGALGTVGWLAWKRRQHDPWLRLLARASARLRRAGVDLPANASPRELARIVAASGLPEDFRSKLAAWLLALERVRYGPAENTQAAAIDKLKRRFNHLRWPGSLPDFGDRSETSG